MAGRKPSVDIPTVVKAVALHPEPVVTAADIHDDLGLSQAGARERLKRLVDDGYLGMKEAGSSALVFWLADKGKRALDDTDLTGS